MAELVRSLIGVRHARPQIDTATIRRELDEILRRRHWTRIVPKRLWENVPGWANHPSALADAVEAAVDGMAILAFEEGERMPYDSSPSALHVFDLAIQARLYDKVFVVGREMAHALWHTNAPEVPIREIPLPMETVFICLPRDNPSGYAWLTVTLLPPSLEDARYGQIRDIILKERNVDLRFKRDRMDDGVWRVIGVTEDWSLSRFQGVVSRPLSTPMSEENTLDDLPIEEADQQVTRYAWSIVASISARPDLIVPATRRHVSRKVGGVRRQDVVYTPVYVGRDYRVASEPGEGHHASPRLHWVRGFYRMQACGPRHSERKLTWIEPFMRGGGGG